MKFCLPTVNQCFAYNSNSKNLHSNVLVYTCFTHLSMFNSTHGKALTIPSICSGLLLLLTLVLSSPTTY